MEIQENIEQQEIRRLIDRISDLEIQNGLIAQQAIDDRIARSRYRAALVALVAGCNRFRADHGRSEGYIQKIEKPLCDAEHLLTH